MTKNTRSNPGALVRADSAVADSTGAERPAYRSRRRSTSDYSRDTERTVERLLGELYAALNIRKPDDLFGSIVIETRYQNGRPVGQVDVNIRYVLKRAADEDREI